MHLISRTLVTFSIALTLAACSDSGSSSSDSSIDIEGWVGAQGFDSAQVIANQVSESGQIAVDVNGIYIGFRESTDGRSKYKAAIQEGESTLLIARGQIADVDRDNTNLATRRQCQLMAGCEIDGNSYAFAEFYPLTSGFEWRSIVYNADDGSRNNVNSVTTLSDAFAYLYDVQNKHENTVYSAYDIVLGNSQLSNLLDLTDVIGDLPANLTELNNLNEAFAGTANQIRYGALIAGLQQLELEYRAAHNVFTDKPFIKVVASEFAADEGQLLNHVAVETRLLTLVALYKTAKDNLTAVLPTITNDSIKSITQQVISLFETQITAAEAQPADSKTTAAADDLSVLLTETEIVDFNLGLEKTKLFVSSLIDYQNTFLEDGYQEELEAYQAMLKAIGDAHKDNLNALVVEFALIQDYYVTCIIGNRECDTSRFVDLETRKDSYDSSTKILILDDGVLTVSQVLANLSVTESGAVTESNAVDVLIVGTLEKNNLVLEVNHTFSDTDKTEISIPSSMRIFYPTIVTEIPKEEETIEGYEIIWGDFQLYDKTVVGSGAETDLSGAFRIFYRGVYDPQNTDVPNSSELRFNIESWVLSALISDSITEGAIDGDTTSLVITATSSNPSLYYPNEKLSSFDGFFTPNNEYNVGEVEAALLTYRLGEELVNFGTDSITVEVIDFLNRLGEDTRYRFYPDFEIEDENDSNGNGDFNEFLTLHLIEECTLEKGTETVSSCGPRTRVFDKRDLQKTINELWELGIFQTTVVDGRGNYFVDFPTTTDAAGCLVLEPLVGTASLDGRLLEQQVLGLNSVRLLTEVSLQDDEDVALPKTLFDMTVIAPTVDKYQVNAALSHNYSGTTTDSADNSEIILGTGTNTNVIRVSYDTSADFENAGNFSVFQGGVELTLGDGSQIVENQDITAFLSRTYDAEAVNYKIIENEEGSAERCVLSVGEIYEKDPADVNQVFYLNYRGVVYGTARPEGDQGIWTIRYIDGTWLIPVTGDNG